ncbi:MAG: acyl-protein synthetase [Oceanospirillales bacterium]|nr:acyl-protein synthetase [Oceanospirillales bacterium]
MIEQTLQIDFVGEASLTDETWLNREPYSLESEVRQHWLLARLNALTHWHQRACEPYARLVDCVQYQEATALQDLYPLAVRLFKQNQLKSIADEEVFRVMTSSGTTTQKVSRIYLDRQTASLQSKALVRIMQSWVGKARLPMLIADYPGVLGERAQFSARGAGIRGMLIFGRQPVYALNEDLTPNWLAIDEFIERWGGQPILLFGFTFMVWQMLEAIERSGRRLEFPQGILIHSGGWKKLQNRAVDNPTFKASAQRTLGVERVHNFYGMVEQVGSVFVECEHGHLHTPFFAEVLIRDLTTGQLTAPGEPGVIEVLSALPLSYPGHVLLTEDIGRVLGVDDCPCGRKGTRFEVLGRLPRAEVRGCSDTVES